MISSVKSSQAPVAESQRIESLDVLRGFALLGILTMNIGAFSMPSATYFDPTAYGDLSGLNGWTWRLTHLFADLKFMAIFSMLFGAGIVLSAQRCEARERPAAGLHYRRMFWLIVFGLLHAHLLWYGDILYWYGMCGLVIFLFRKLRPRTLIILGLLSLSVASGLMLVAGATADQWPDAMLEEISAELKPSSEAKAEEIAIYRGGWLEQMEMRTKQSLAMQTETFLFWSGWRVSGLMLLGMALFKLGVFSAERSQRVYLALIAVALGVGVPIVAYGIRYNFANDWQAPYFFFYGLQFNYWASLLVSLGWVSVVMLACQQRFAPFTRPLAAVGRLAFSNYILQTVICTSLFYGHGLGLYGHVDRLGQAGLVVVIWAFQLILSPLWLRHFRFGPLEWLWRSLVYLRLQPFRRTHP